MSDRPIDEFCAKCPILNSCRREDCVGCCEGNERNRREMIRDASYAQEQANGADYGNI